LLKHQTKIFWRKFYHQNNPTVKTSIVEWRQVPEISVDSARVKAFYEFL